MVCRSCFWLRPRRFNREIGTTHRRFKVLDVRSSGEFRGRYRTLQHQTYAKRLFHISVPGTINLVSGPVESGDDWVKLEAVVGLSNHAARAKSQSALIFEFAGEQLRVFGDVFGDYRNDAR